MSATVQVKPSKVWMWLGAGLMVAGVVSAAVLAVSAFMVFTRSIDRFARITIPNELGCRLTFDEPGKYRLYYEYQGIRPVRDTSCEATTTEAFDAPSKPPLGLEVSFRAPDGRIITPERPEAEEKLTNGRHTGVSIGEIDVPVAGQYGVEVDGDVNGEFVLAVGRWPTLPLAKSLGLAVGCGALGIALGLPMLLVTRSKRRKAVRAASIAVLTAPPPPSAWPPPPTLG